MAWVGHPWPSICVTSCSHYPFKEKQQGKERTRRKFLKLATSVCVCLKLASASVHSLLSTVMWPHLAAREGWSKSLSWPSVCSAEKCVMKEGKDRCEGQRAGSAATGMEKTLAGFFLLPPALHPSPHPACLQWLSETRTCQKLLTMCVGAAESFCSCFHIVAFSIS